VDLGEADGSGGDAPAVIVHGRVHSGRGLSCVGRSHKFERSKL
jgi:hypothetical protein